MKIGDIINVVKSGGGHWKGEVTDMSDGWTHTLQDGTALQAPYTSTIITVNEIGGKGHAVFHERNLVVKDGEYYERG